MKAQAARRTGQRKQVYIIHTGGTIGMAKTAVGYAPQAGFLATQLARLPELADLRMPAFAIHELTLLLDLANMTPANWAQIAADIYAHYDDYDGFLVLHGTDTMAYTASALPFILRQTRKPIIITGSQIPLCELRSDGRENLITGLLLAAESEILEVCLFFGDRVLRGCRSVKVSVGAGWRHQRRRHDYRGRAGETHLSVERRATPAEVKTAMGRSLRGELSVKPPRGATQ